MCRIRAGRLKPDPAGRSFGHPQGQSREAKPAPSCRVLIARLGVFTCRCCWFPPDKNALDKQEFPAGPGAVAQRGMRLRRDVHPCPCFVPGGSPVLHVTELQEGHEAALPPHRI